MTIPLKVVKRYKNIPVDMRQCVTLPCDLCGADEVKLITVSNGFNLVKCRKCGFVYINPRPPQKILRDYYQGYFLEEDEHIDAWKREFRSLYLEVRNRINKAHKAKGRILDIGCSFGFFLELMRDDGWDVFGLDYSKFAVDYATNVLKLPNIIWGGMEDGNFTDNYFDVVTMFYVLEHVVDPSETLRLIHQNLKRQGLFINRVPYTKPLIPFYRMLGEPGFEAPMHLSDFSPKTMAMFLEKTGFEDIEIFVSRPRRLADFGPRMAISSLTWIGRVLYKLSSRKFIFPWVGAFMSLARKR
jgi:SAM-dependent methyltransferase